LSTLFCYKEGRVALRDGVNPNPKQQLLFKSTKKHIGYGGARGGGKSWSLRVKFSILALKYANLKILLLRRTYPELEANHIIPLQSELKGLAKYKETKRVFTFGNGSIIKLGHCKSEKDMFIFQGQEYDVIGFEEATLFTETQIRFIMTCLRSTRTDFVSRIYYTCNPGGVSHHFIKRIFIDCEYEEGEDPSEYEFIQALIYDNEVLMKNDPGYMKILNSMSPDLIAAHRDGDWDALSGAYFKEFKKPTHVIDPIILDPSWYRYVVIDYGLDMLAAYWIADDGKGQFYAYKELCKPELIISDAALALKEFNDGDRIIFWYAPPDMQFRQKDTGKSSLEVFHENGIPFITTKNDRVEGWLMVKELLKVRSVKQVDGSVIRKPQLLIFSNCTQLIKHLPIIQRDLKNPNDCSKEPHDITHSPDAIRYFASEYVKLPDMMVNNQIISGVWHRRELIANGHTPAQINEWVRRGYIKLIGEA
jgi:phage terminase large subunit